MAEGCDAGLKDVLYGQGSIIRGAARGRRQWTGAGGGAGLHGSSLYRRDRP